MHRIAALCGADGIKISWSVLCRVCSQHQLNMILFWRCQMSSFCSHCWLRKCFCLMKLLSRPQVWIFYWKIEETKVKKSTAFCSTVERQNHIRMRNFTLKNLSGTAKKILQTRRRRLEVQNQCLPSNRRAWKRVRGSQYDDCCGWESIVQKAEAMSKWQSSKGPLSLGRLEVKAQMGKPSSVFVEWVGLSE